MSKNKSDFWSLCSLGMPVLLCVTGVFCNKKVTISGFAQTGYSVGQNNFSWPRPKTILDNNNRGGFYLNQFNLAGKLSFDTTLYGNFEGNMAHPSLVEGFVHKDWNNFGVTLGKFRGAGIKTGSGTHEKDLSSLKRPFYARYWNNTKRLHNFRDYGFQVEYRLFSNRVTPKIFLHNANAQIIDNQIEYVHDAPITQALGIDFQVDINTSPYHSAGFHSGAMANRSWSEFSGGNKFWKADRWFQYNSVVDFSFNNHIHTGKFNLLNEVMIMKNRDLVNTSNPSPAQTWAVYTLGEYLFAEKYSLYLSYEFFDLTDGFVRNDALHVNTLGFTWSVPFENKRGIKSSVEYIRPYEEGFENITANDIFSLDLQISL